jgi:hypothetical protein
MQSSQVLRALPVVISGAALVAPLARAGAQIRYRVAADDAWFCQQAAGKRLAVLPRGVALAADPSAADSGDWRAVTLDGWIYAPSVGPTTRMGFDLVVTANPQENLRGAPGGPVITKLPQGFLLSKVDAEGRWVHVRRTGWMAGASLEPVAQALSARRAAPDSGAPPPDTGAPTDSARLEPARRTTLYRAPDGPAAGTIAQATPLRVLSRSGQWARVEFEGWVKAADLETAPPGALVGVSAAEVRADPQRYVGQTLRWRLQYLAQAQADELRPEIPAGATYLLTRGPLPERGFVYVVVPDAKLPLVRRLAPLSLMVVTARVRAGRSRYLGNPVVDLLTLDVEPEP